MIPVALYHNKPVKQNIVGRLRHEVLRPERKPLPTLPPIVGNSRYKPEMMEAGNTELPVPSNPGVEFIKRRMMSVRRFNPNVPMEISEPNNNSPNRY
jgi:hypothetical protein